MQKVQSNDAKHTELFNQSLGHQDLINTDFHAQQDDIVHGNFENRNYSYNGKCSLEQEHTNIILSLDKFKTLMGGDEMNFPTLNSE